MHIENGNIEVFFSNIKSLSSKIADVMLGDFHFIQETHHTERGKKVMKKKRAYGSVGNGRN